MHTNVIQRNHALVRVRNPRARGGVRLGCGIGRWNRIARRAEIKDTAELADAKTRECKNKGRAAEGNEKDSETGEERVIQKLAARERCLKNRQFCRRGTCPLWFFFMSARRRSRCRRCWCGSGSCGCGLRCCCRSWSISHTYHLLFTNAAILQSRFNAAETLPINLLKPSKSAIQAI